MTPQSVGGQTWSACKYIYIFFLFSENHIRVCLLRRSLMSHNLLKSGRMHVNTREHAHTHQLLLVDENCCISLLLFSHLPHLSDHKAQICPLLFLSFFFLLIFNFGSSYNLWASEPTPPFLLTSPQQPDSFFALPQILQSVSFYSHPFFIFYTHHFKSPFAICFISSTGWYLLVNAASLFNDISTQ